MHDFAKLALQLQITNYRLNMIDQQGNEDTTDPNYYPNTELEELPTMVGNTLYLNLSVNNSRIDFIIDTDSPVTVRKN